MLRERANIYMIAKEAGVSPATVSRVLTNNARVSAEKRERVEAVIQKYGYMPNALAQGLSTAKTHTIGLLIADISSPFYAAVAAECERVAQSRGYMLLIFSSLSDTTLEMQQLRKLYEQQVDAILIVGGYIDHVVVDEEYVELVNRIVANIPIISTGKPTGAECGFVTLDEAGSMEIAMEYLMDLGHRRIALVGGRKDAKSTLEKRLRYRRMLRQKEIEYREDYVYETIDYANESGYVGMKQLLGLKERPTAVIAINDFTASGVIRAIHEAGLRIPEDISVIAFDNTYLSVAMTPQLTSVGCNYAELASALVDTAIEATISRQIPEDYVVPVSLTERDSCGKVQ